VVTEAEVAGFTLEAVDELSRRLDEPEWVRELRREAFRTFEELPMPSRTDEEWRRTDIRRLKLERLPPYAPASGAPAESPLGSNHEASTAVLIQDNAEPVSRWVRELSPEQGVIACSLDEAARTYPDLVRKHLQTAVPPRAGKFPALNGALWSGGAFVYVPTGVDVALPVRALFSLSRGGSAIFPRTLIVLEQGARLTYIEEYASPDLRGDVGLSAGVVEVIVGEEARLTQITLQEYQGDLFDLNTQRALLQRDARLDWLVIGLGDVVTKSNIEVAMQGPGAETQMLGILWGYDHQHTDYHTLQDHQAPNCTSDLLYKGALIDEAQSVFSGRIRVEKGAHRTDSYQANRTVILSDHASAYPSPNLEIEANDVRCTHGASVGKVDADQLFYLMSRGLSRELATKMIVEGFFEEVLQREPAGAVRDNLRELITRKMEAGPSS